MLLGFKKTDVPAHGKICNVTVGPLRVQDFEMWSSQHDQYIVEPGIFSLYVALSSDDPHAHRLQVTVTA